MNGKFNSYWQLLAYRSVIGGIYFVILIFGVGRILVSVSLANYGYVKLIHSMGMNSESLMDSSAMNIAQPFWSKAIRLDTQNQSALRGWAWVLISNNSSPDAIVEAWNIGGLTPELLISQGEMARLNEKYEQALYWFHLATLASPTSRDPWFLTGWVYEDMKDWGQAAGAYRIALTKTDGNFGESDVYFYFGWLTHKKYPAGDHKLALEAYEKALAVHDFTNPDWESWTHQYSAQILMEQDRFLEALNEDEAAVRVNPYNYYAKVEVAYLYWLAKGDALTSERDLKLLIAMRPEQYIGYWFLATVYQETGRVEEAIAMYRAVLSLRPDVRNAQEAICRLEESQHVFDLDCQSTK